jgi:hypothetical protein
VCRSHPSMKLPVLCPVDDAGCFTVDAGEDLVGLHVLKDGNLVALKVRVCPLVSGLRLHNVMEVA